MATKGRSSLSTHPLYGFNFITKFPKKAELVNYLGELHQDLSTLEQDVQKAPRGLATTITHLINPKVLESTDRDIRVLAGCCIVDVLRIYAPEAPFKDADMVRVYDMLIGQIRGLQTVLPDSEFGKHIVYIVNSLANVKSCVVPVIMSQSNVPGASDLVQSLFEVIVNTVRAELDDETLLRFSEILHACIEEFEGISEDLLDILLQPLLPVAKDENPTAFRVVAVVLRAVAPLIRNTVTEVIHNILVGSTSKLNGKLSEMAEDVYPLIYELHRISPEIISDIIPSLCMQLKVEEEVIRHNAVKLLCSLFTSDLADYAKDFPRDFKDFLGRLNDLFVDIRQDMLQCCGVLLKTKVDLNVVEEMVAKRLRDPDEGIRLTALKKLLEYSHTHISTVSIQTLNEISDRAKDKKFDIRKLALEGLAKLYHRHFSSKLLPLSSLEWDKEEGLGVALTSGIPTAIKERLEGVPGVIMKSWGFPDMASKHLCVRLIQEYLLPKPIQHRRKNDGIENSETLDDEDQSMNDQVEQENEEEIEGPDKSSKRNGNSSKQPKKAKNIPPKHGSSSDPPEESEYISNQRATALLVLYASFDDTDKSCFTSMLAFKAKAHEELNHFLNAKLSQGNESVRLSEVAVSTQQQPSVIFQMKQVFVSLTQHVPPMDSKRATTAPGNAYSSLLEKLMANKDRTVYKLIGNCLGSEDDIQQALLHRNDLQQRLDSKSALGEYFGMVYDFAGNMICNTSIMESLLDLLSKGCALLGTEEMGPVAEIVCSIIRFAPKLAKSCSKHFVSWLNQLHQQSVDSGSKKKGKQASSSQMKQFKQEAFGYFYGSLVCCSRYLEEKDEYKEELAKSIIRYLNELDDADQCQRLGELLGHIAFCSTEINNTNQSSDISTAAMPGVTAYIRSICSKSSFNLERNSRIMQQFMSLLALTSIPSATYETLSHLKLCTDRILRALNSTLRIALFEFIQHDILQSPTRESQETEEEEGSTSMELKCVALKLWTSILCCDSENYIFRKAALKVQSENKDSRSNGESSSATNTTPPEDDSLNKPNINGLMAIVFGCLESHGAELAGYNVIGKTDQEQAYYTAAWCGLQLMRVRTYGDKLSPVQWQELAWSLLGVENRTMKRQLLLTLVSIIQTHPVHIKFLTFPCLFANDHGDHNAEYAQRGLIFAIKRLRKTQEDIGTKVIQEEEEKRRSKYQRMATFTMPEMIMPYLLHLLSYSPDFPRSVALDNEDDKKRMKSVVRCVSSLLTALQSTLRVETSNLPYLFKQLNTINRDYVDRLDHDNIGVHFVTRLTVKLLNEQVKTVENLQVHPGDITLPADLYSMSLGDGKGRSHIQEGLELAEQSINKILQISGKGRGNKATIASPVAVKRARSPAASAEKVRPEKRLSFDAEDDRDQAPAKKKVVKTSNKIASSKAAQLEAEPAPSRVMPKRSAKGVAPSYVEKEEDEEEVEKWNEQAGTNSRRISSSSVRGSANDVISSDLEESGDSVYEKLRGNKRKLSANKSAETAGKLEHATETPISKEKATKSKGLKSQAPNQHPPGREREKSLSLSNEGTENLSPPKRTRRAT